MCNRQRLVVVCASPWAALLPFHAQACKHVHAHTHTLSLLRPVAYPRVDISPIISTGTAFPSLRHARTRTQHSCRLLYLLPFLLFHFAPSLHFSLIYSSSVTRRARFCSPLKRIGYPSNACRFQGALLIPRNNPCLWLAGGFVALRMPWLRDARANALRMFRLA